MPSLIRIIDRVTFQIAEGQPTPPFTVYAAITLKAGMMRGKSKLTVRGIAPSGNPLPDLNIPLLFEGGDDRGVGIHAQINLAGFEEGLYWFEVSTEETGILTKLPLRVIFQPPTLTGTGSSD
ncbi:MAG: hypothetical protein HY047_16245 [Acidobacteria bacterium]|nr:hypothetical protein [Acidobacteriota bacterium]